MVTEAEQRKQARVMSERRAPGCGDDELGLFFDHTEPFCRDCRDRSRPVPGMPNRGQALVIDSGWREVADTALTFVGRFV
jgi:hypothetical protein